MATTRGTQEKLDMGSENDGTEEPPPSIEEILHGTAHAMTIFTAKEKAALDARIFFKKSKPYLECYATGKDRSAKPEEIVRQLYRLSPASGEWRGLKINQQTSTVVAELTSADV